MSLKAVGTDTEALADDLFSAGFDEGLSNEITQPEGDAKTDPEPEQKTDPEPEQKTDPEPEQKTDPEPEQNADPSVDIKALVAEAIAATKVEPAKVEPVKEEPVAAIVRTPEEIAAEEQYRKDWPEHAAREDRLKKELEDVKTLLTTTVEALKGQIAPVIESTNLSAEEKHYNTIYTAHADAEKIYPDVVKWIETQPKFLQPQYTKVLADGSAIEIVELFSTFKTATGASIQTSDPTKAAEDVKKQETAARLKRMEVTDTVRTSVTSEDDPDDFDAAFEAEAKKLKIAA